MTLLRTRVTGFVAALAALALVLGSATSASAATASEEASVMVGDIPVRVAISPDGTLAYVGNTSVAGTVSVIDIAARAVVATISVGSRPYGIAFTPDGATAYVVNRDSGTVSVIDVATNAVTATITAGNQSYGATMSLDGSLLYVADSATDTVTVISTATNTVTTTIAVPDSPIWIATNPVSGVVYVTSMDAQQLTAISGTSVVGTSLNVPGAYDVEVSPDGTQIYVSDLNTTGNISVVSESSFTITNTISTGVFFYGMAFTPSGEYLLYPNNTANTLNRVAVSSGTVTPGDGYPLALSQNSASNVAVTPDCTQALVVTPNYPIGGGPGYVSIVSTGFANCTVVPTPTPTPTPSPELAQTGSTLDSSALATISAAVIFSVIAGAVLLAARRRTIRK